MSTVGEAALALKGTHDALDRMRRAHERGTGCHLTAQMIDSLGLSMIGQLWQEDRPVFADDAPSETGEAG